MKQQLRCLPLSNSFLCPIYSACLDWAQKSDTINSNSSSETSSEWSKLDQQNLHPSLSGHTTQPTISWYHPSHENHISQFKTTEERLAEPSSDVKILDHLLESDRRWLLVAHSKQILKQFRSHWRNRHRHRGHEISNLLVNTVPENSHKQVNTQLPARKTNCTESKSTLSFCSLKRGDRRVSSSCSASSLEHKMQTLQQLQQHGSYMHSGLKKN